MGKNTDIPSGLDGSSTLDIDEVLPYQEQVVALYSKKPRRDDKTVAYARLAEETLETLAAVGEAPYASIVEGALEYKLSDFDDELDDPLRDLGWPTGSTKFFFVQEQLAKMGIDLDSWLSKEEESDFIRFLDDFENDKLPWEKSAPESVNKFVTKAVESGVSRSVLNRLFNKAKNRCGVLVGLSKEFLKDAGEDVWPADKGIGNNHPCRYAKIHGGLSIKYMTQIVPLDETSTAVMDALKDHLEKSKQEQSISSRRRSTQKDIEGLGLIE